MRLVPNKFPAYTDPAAPRIAIIGEAPGEDEEREGTPFVGYSGQLLSKVCAKVGLLRSSCFIGNVYQYHPPGNNLKLINRSSIEWQTSVATLQKELNDFNPTLTIALGETSLKELTGRTGITRWRGSIVPNTLLGRSKVLAAYHPAYILRQYKWLPILEFDFRKALEEAKFPDLNLPVRTYETSPSFPRVLEYLNSLLTVPAFAFDFETLRDNGLPLCLGFSDSPSHSLCIPFGECWTATEEWEIWKAIERVMHSPAVKIIQNSLFDLQVLAVWPKIWVEGPIFDTMIAFHACYPELPKKLSFITSVLTREPYYKHEHKESEEEDNEKGWSPKTSREKLHIYNCKDCCVTYELHARLIEELGHTKAWEGFKTDTAMIPLALSMTLRGTKFDYDAASLRYAELEADIEAIDTLITQYFGKPVNSKSPKQVCEILYQDLKLPVQRIRDASGAWRETANADALLKLATLYPNNAGLMLLLRNRQLRTKQAFFDCDVYKDGRIHASNNVAGTETGRWSSSACLLKGRCNMNVPEDCRDVWIAG